MQFKYVVMAGEDKQDNKHEVVFLFPGVIYHKDFLRFRRHENFHTDGIIAAGFVDIGLDGKPYCHGFSESLGGIKSRGQIDADLIANSSKYPYSSMVPAK